MSATKMTTGLSAAVLTGGMVLVGPSASALTPADPEGTSPTGGGTGEISGVQQTSVGHRCGALFAHSHAHGVARAAEVTDGGPAATAWWNSLMGTGIASADLSGRGLHCGLLAQSTTPSPATPIDDKNVADTPDANKAEVDEVDATDDKADRDEAELSNEGQHARSTTNSSSPGHGWAGHHGRHHSSGAGR